ncbi:hypothetical protein DXG01_001312 [Tephrocybe rancida]|nr:hypothetical protein DXG01_001312 [Tephrocybe rancida]
MPSAEPSSRTRRAHRLPPRRYRIDFITSPAIEPLPRRAAEPPILSISGSLGTWMDDATFVDHGRHFGRTVHTFNNGILRLMNQGRYLSNILIGQLGVANLNEAEQAAWKLYRPLLAMIPQLEGFQAGSSTMRISKLICRGILAARLHDKGTIRAIVFSCLVVTFSDAAQGLEGLDKADLGLNHPLTGSLLCPVDLDWDDPPQAASTETQAEIKAGTFKNQEWGWPSFVYAFGPPLEPEDLWKGLFRNPFLVTAYKHIFTSRRSVFTHIQLNGSTQPGDQCIDIPSDRSC